jgi:hypothetical protein
MKSISLVTERELSKELSFGEYGIRQLRKEGKIPFVRLGHRSIRYNLAEVARALKKLTKGVA